MNSRYKKKKKKKKKKKRRRKREYVWRLVYSEEFYPEVATF
jgi:hypothetical protein